MTFKIVELKNFSIYVNNDTKTTIFSLNEDISDEEFNHDMKNLINKKSNELIVNPLSTQVKISLQQIDFFSPKIPRVSISCDIKEISFNIHELQYQSLLQTIEYFVNFNYLEELRRMKPKTKLNKKNPKEWLNFVIQVSRNEVSKNYFSWKEVLQRKKDREDYIKLYKRFKKVAWLPELQGSDLERFKQIESRISYEDLLLFRRMSQAEIKIELEKNSEYISYLQKKKMKDASWFGWFEKDENAPDVFHLSEDQKKELYKEIEYDVTQYLKKTTFPDDHIKYQVSLNLKEANLSLVDSKTQNPFVEASIHSFDAEFNLRVDSSSSTKISLGGFEINDLITENPLFKRVAKRRETIESSKTSLASIIVEYKPPSKKSDLYIGVDIDRIDFMLNFSLIQKIISFFVIPSMIKLDILEKKAKQQLTIIQSHAQTHLFLALESRSVIDLNVNIKAPTLIIPESSDEKEPSLLLIDFGTFKLNSDIDIVERKERIKYHKTQEDDYYDKYQLLLSNIQVLICETNDWKVGNIKGKQILEKFEFRANLWNCITPDNIELTKTKIDGKMSSTKFNISSTKLKTLMKISNNALKLLDHPTGYITQDIKVSNNIDMKGPNDKDWSKYWIELRENNGIIIYKSQSNINPIAKIIIHNKMSVQDLKTSENNHTFKLLIPQINGESQEFFFSCESNDVKRKWINKLKEEFVQHAQNLIMKDDDDPRLESSYVIQMKPPNQKILHLGFNLAELSLNIDSVDNNQENEFLSLGFKNLSLDFIMRPYDQSLKLNLESLSISDKKEKKDIISCYGSNENQALASLSLFRSFDKNSELYNEEAEIIADMKLQIVKIFYDPNTLNQITNLVTDLLSVRENIESRMVYYKIKEKIDLEEKKIPTRPPIKLSTKMEKLSLTLLDDGTFLSISLKKGSISFVHQLEGGYIIKGVVGDVIVLDHDPYTAYKEILGLNNKNGSLVEFTYLQKPKIDSKDPYYGKDLKIKLNSVKLVYLHRITRKIIAYFSSQPISNKISESTKKVAKQVVQETAKNTEKLHFEFEFTNPVIVLPLHYKSEDMIAGDLGNIYLSNSLEKGKDDLSEHYKLTLSKVNLVSNLMKKEQTLLSNTDMFFNFKFALINPNNSVPGFSLDSNISKVSIRLSQEQYQSFFQMIKGNFGDRGDIIEINNSSTLQETVKDVNETKEIVEKKETKDYILSSYKIEFPNLNMLLLRGNGKNSFGQENLIAQLDMNNFTFLYLSRSDLSSELKFSISSMNANDKRNGTRINAFSEFINCGDVNDQKNQFLDFSVLWLPSSDKIMNIVLGNPRIIFIPNLIQEIIGFFTESKKDKELKKELFSSSKYTGDLKVNSNISLGENMILSSKRKLYIEKNESKEVIIDACGYKLVITSDTEKKDFFEPLIFIADGMTLTLKNIVIESNINLNKLISLGEGSKFNTPTTMGVIKRLSETLESKPENIEKNESPKGKTIITGLFGKPKLIFVENFTSENSILIVAEFSCSIAYNSTGNEEHACINFGGIQIYKENNQNIESSAILEPVKINVEMTGKSTNNTIERTIELVVTNEIQSRISFEDIKLIMKIAQNLKNGDQKPVNLERKGSVTSRNNSMILSPKPSLKNLNDSLEEEIILTETSEEGDYSDDDWKEIQSDNEEDEKTIETSQIVVKKKESYEISLHSTKFSILLVDDIKGFDIPLIDFQLLDFHSNITWNESNLLINMRFQIYAAYYNLKLAGWEPIIEYFGCSMKSAQKDTGSLIVPKSNYLYIHPLEKELGFDKNVNPLLINVTKSMIDTVLTTSKLWSEGLKSQFSVSTKFNMYCIRNETGFTIEFFRENQNSIKLDTNKEYGFNLGKKGDQKNGIFFFKIPGVDQYMVDIKKVCKQMIVNDSKEIVVFLEIDFIDGRKIINVRSGLRVENTTTIDWMIGISTDNLNIVQIGTIKPKGILAVPMNMIKNGAIFVKPSTLNDSFSWSSGVKLLGIMKIGSNSKASLCSNSKKNNDSYYTTLKVISSKMINPHKKEVLERKPFLYQKYDYIIKLCTPLSLENLLVSSIEYELYEHSDSKIKISEGTIQRGEKIHLYNANLKNSILLKAKLPGTNWVDHYSIIHSSKNEKLASRISIFNEDDTQKFDLHFDYINNSDIAVKEVLLFCPYWIINHTGLKLIIKEELESDQEKYHGDKQNDEVLMFSFTPFTSKRKIFIRINDSTFSQPFSIDNVGMTGNLILLSEKRQYDVGLSISLCPGKFKRTKSITLNSRFIIVNQSNYLLQCKQYNTEKIIEIGNGKKVNFYLPEKYEKDSMISIKIPSENYLFSSPFKLTTLDEFSLKIPSKGTLPPIILNVFISFENATITIFIQKPDKPPYIIDNRTNETILISQLLVNKWTKILAKTKHEYCWDESMGTHALNLKISETLVKIDFDIYSKKKKLTLDNNKNIYISVHPKGSSNILVIRDENEKKTRKIINSDEDIYDLGVTAFFDGVGISLIDDTQEIAFIFLKNVDFRFLRSQKRKYLDAGISSIQIDNQLKIASYPVLLTTKEKDQFMKLSIVQSLEDDSTLVFPLFSFKMEEITIALDYVFFMEFSRYIEKFTFSTDEENQENLKKLLSSSSNTFKVKKATKYYFNQFEIYPIKVVISFRYNKTKGEEVSDNPVMILIDSLGVTIANIEKANIQLNSLQLNHSFEPLKNMIEKVKLHYIRAIISEFYKILGSLDIIGNPIGLFSNFSIGVQDLFNEPIKAQDSDELKKAMTKGTLSLLMNTVHGTFNSASKVTGSIGRGLSILSFDSDYIQDREKNQEKPKDFKQGLIEGTESLLKGMYDGASGIILKPIEGAKESGIEGFFKGLGIGIIGAPVKSFTAFLDFATKTTEGISNFTNIEKEINGRLRFPRTFSQEGLVVSYSPTDSFVQYLLSTMEGSIYEKQKLVSFSSSERHIIILTQKYLFCVDPTKKLVDWRLELVAIQKLFYEERFVKIQFLYDQKPKTLKILLHPTKSKIFLKKLENQIKLKRKEKSQK